MRRKYVLSQDDISIIGEHAHLTSNEIQKRFLKNVPYKMICEYKRNISCKESNRKFQPERENYFNPEDMVLPKIIDYNIYAWRNGYELLPQ